MSTTPRRLGVVLLAAVLTVAAASTAGAVLPIPQLGPILGPGAITDDDIVGMKIHQPEIGCKDGISLPHYGRGPALTHGPFVDGVVGKAALVCWGAPAERIRMTLTISRERSIVTKVTVKQPPGQWFRYESMTLAMRGSYFIHPDRYWVTVQTDYTQAGKRFSHWQKVSPKRALGGITT